MVIIGVLFPTEHTHMGLVEGIVNYSMHNSSSLLIFACDVLMFRSLLQSSLSGSYETFSFIYFLCISEISKHLFWKYLKKRNCFVSYIFIKTLPALHTLMFVVKILHTKCRTEWNAQKTNITKSYSAVLLVKWWNDDAVHSLLWCSRSKTRSNTMLYFSRRESGYENVRIKTISWKFWIWTPDTHSWSILEFLGMQHRWYTFFTLKWN